MSPASVKVGVVDVAILIPDRRISYWAPALPSHAIETVFAVVPTSRRLLGALPDGGGVGEGALVAVGVGVGVAVVPGWEASVAVRTGVVMPPARTEYR